MSFQQRELDETVITKATAENPRGFSVTYASPISARENFKRAHKHEALWIPYRGDQSWFCPEVIPDNIARAYVTEAGKYEGPKGGKDMFGITWEYVPSARGSIVRPGNPTLKAIEDWKEVIKFPDVDSWDWEGSGKKNKEYLHDATKLQMVCMFTGWFERLISFMDFGPAALALMNRKKQPYVKELFEKLTDMYIKIIDHCAEVYGDGIDGFTFHDDWGSQHAPFFHVGTVQEMIVPYMKKVTECIHKHGYICELHSCGKVDPLIGCIVDAGWDSWDGMAINDAVWDYENYGDKLMIKTHCEFPKDATPEQAKEAARKFFEQFGNRNKPIILANTTAQVPEFYLELYRLARLAYEE